jgi:uncharacterized membrane protein SpoIIM required for sporulation
MIEFFKELYAFLVTGAGVTLLVGALLYWYMIYTDNKQTDDFDKKYRESRDVNNKFKN